jgi:hypothetical protein
MEKKDFKIFYSWQSDIDPKFNNYFIKDCLEKAVKEISSDNSLEIIPTLDKDVKGETGSPNIVDVILKKIDACQIFVADVTLINDKIKSKAAKRPTPNPNVLIELGYSLNRLSWERIICINNKDFSKVERLPFDLKQNRISQYSFSDLKLKSKAKKELTDLLSHAIKEIIKNYDKIEEKSRSANISSHDKLIFSKIDPIIGDSEFIDLLQQIANNQFLRQRHYRLFDKIYDFLRADENKFLSQEIEKAAIELKESLGRMRGTLAKNFHSKYDSWSDETGQEQHELVYTWSEQILFEYKEIKTEENVNALADTVSKYKSFRLAVKKSLLL